MLSGQVIHTLCTAKGLKSKNLEKLPSGTRTFLLSEYLKYLTSTLMRVHLNASGFFDDDVINSDDDVMTARSKAIKGSGTCDQHVTSSPLSIRCDDGKQQSLKRLRIQVLVINMSYHPPVST
jgi:hypothetical protein